jgi:hypothetical protein
VPSLGNSSEGEEVKDSVSFGNIVAEVKRISSAVEGNQLCSTYCEDCSSSCDSSPVVLVLLLKLSTMVNV